ncbi:MAG TPA: diguanylate cyclase [Baekduia sp.]|nr:diguanylate cyclase [Baekduia sp.]
MTDEFDISDDELGAIADEQLFALLDRMPQPMDLFTADGRLRYSNTASREFFAQVDWVETYDKPLREIEWDVIGRDGEPIEYSQHPMEIARLTGTSIGDLDLGFKRRDRGRVWIRSRARAFGNEGPPYSVIESFTDISAECEAEMGLRQANKLFAQAFEHAPLGMAIVDLDGQILRVNPALCALLGYSEEQLLQSNVVDLTHQDDTERDADFHDRQRRDEVSNYQLHKRYIHADGHVIECQLSVALITDDAGKPIYAIGQMQDVTAQRRLEARLQELADHDYLTGLLNRRRFERELATQLDRCNRHGERAAVLLLDIDRFKEVNDSRGHAVGDQVLKDAAEVLEQRVRGTDRVARIGGDEFAAILVETDEAGALQVGKALIQSLRETGAHGITGSVGIAAMRAGDGVDAVLARADRALYAVKRAGRDGVRLDRHAARKGPVAR